MKTKIPLHLLLAWLFAIPLIAGPADKNATNNSAGKAGIVFTEYGIDLYGKFRFESEGELFDISDNGAKELIPPGAVLVCIRRSYSIGYFAGGATVTDGAKTFKAPKVFFVMKPNGAFTFHLPSPDGNFIGRQIPNTIVFEALYKPKNDKEAQQDGGGQPATRSESK